MISPSMSNSQFDLDRFEQEPVMGILRGVEENSLQGVMEAAISAGLRFIEITLNTENAPEIIHKSLNTFAGKVCVGAGTVRSLEDAETAVAAGAKFLVSPGLNPGVAEYCRKNNLAFFPGALTPTEIENAWAAGATMVKVFPASQMGPNYLRLIKGPLQDIKLMAVGGVNPENIPDYLGAGASAVALGGSIFSLSRMKNGEFEVIQKKIEEFLLAVRNFYSNMK